MNKTVLATYIVSFILWVIVIPAGLFILFSSKTSIELNLLITSVQHESDWQSFTYLNSLRELFKQGNFILAIVIIIFVFFGPLIKYINISLRFFNRSMKSNIILKLLSKAAMVDVFVISLLLMISYKNENLIIKPGIGIYLLAGSIVLFIIAEVFDEMHLKSKEKPEIEEPS